MPISRASGIDIHYDTAGDGPALVMIHAMPFDRHLWLYQQARLSDRFTTIAMDLRGWGASSKPRDPFTLEQMGADVLGVLAAVGVASGAIVMGCSIGSKIALMLACTRPDLIRAAILIGGNSGPQHQFEHRIASYRSHAADGTLAEYHLGHLRHGVTEVWADSPIGRYLIDGFVERGRDLDADSIARVFEALTTSDLTPHLSALRMPILIVNGEHDNALKGGRRTAGLIAGAQHEILPGTGHCCFLENPQGFDRIVMQFLANHGLLPRPTHR